MRFTLSCKKYTFCAIFPSLPGVDSQNVRCRLLTSRRALSNGASFIEIHRPTRPLHTSDIIKKKVRMCVTASLFFSEKYFSGRINIDPGRRDPDKPIYPELLRPDKLFTRCGRRDPDKPIYPVFIRYLSGRVNSLSGRNNSG